MRRPITLTAVLAVVVAAVVVGIVAFAGGGSDSGGTATAAGNSGLVSTRSVDGRTILVDSGGQTLYSATVEKNGRIRCTGACESFWDPVAASSNQAASASADVGLDFGVVKRPDGSEQLALDGRPLYSFKEEGPGKLDGDGFVDDFQGTHFEWQVVTAGGSSGGGTGSEGTNAPNSSYSY
jgi:predicted lipoprotein with Yx(FWY)xxD motif